MGDLRIEIVMEHLFMSGAYDRDDIGIPMAKTRAWMILDALDGLPERSTPTPSPGAGVPVRVAVAMSADGTNWRAYGSSNAPNPGQEPWDHAVGPGRRKAAILTATVQPPSVATIAATVQPVGER